MSTLSPQDDSVLAESNDQSSEKSAALLLPPSVRFLRIFGLIEGTSTLILFGIAMPLKYGWGMDMAVRIVGSVHGGLFMIYILLAFIVLLQQRWPWRLGMWMFIGSVLPFGPFVVDRKIPGWYRSHHANGASD